ncbi:MAG: imidazole glycerol phosphate synthase subunit HisF [Deltaproteobacteria bacterium]|nr:imidazole glycerol phosphate synthase subunit HisF [Deltaproteobacteria bacterium]
MLAVRIIPCLDIRDGRVVKGVRFQSLRDAGSPEECAERYEAQGADEIVLLDVSATPEGRRTAVETVCRVRARLSIPLTVGGGVRTIDDAAALLDAGADKVGVNTAAVEDPSLLTRLADRFGRQCTVLALDAARNLEPSAISHQPSAEIGNHRSEITDRPGYKGAFFGPASEALGTPDSAQATSGKQHSVLGRWEVVTLSGKKRTGIDAVQWAKDAAAAGAGEILLTSWDRDGTRSGYDLDLIRAVSSAVQVPIIASGGANTPDHLFEALVAGADAVLAASIFHDSDLTVGDVKRALAARGVEVRL